MGTFYKCLQPAPGLCHFITLDVSEYTSFTLDMLEYTLFFSRCVQVHVKIFVVSKIFSKTEAMLLTLCAPRKWISVFPNTDSSCAVSKFLSKELFSKEYFYLVFCFSCWHCRLWSNTTVLISTSLFLLISTFL